MLCVQGEYDDLLRVYAELRAEAYKTHGMPVAVRHLESMIRMAEAHARMHLREFVTHADIQVGAGLNGCGWCSIKHVLTLCRATLL